MARLVSVGAPAHSAAREPAAETSRRVEALVSHAGVIVSAGGPVTRRQLCQREGEDEVSLRGYDVEDLKAGVWRT